MLNEEIRLDYLHRERMAVRKSLDQSTQEEKKLCVYRLSSAPKLRKIAEIRGAISAMQLWLKHIEQREASLRLSLIKVSNIN